MTSAAEKSPDADAVADTAGRDDTTPDERSPDAARRLLVIEDEPGIVDFVRRGLEAEGFIVEAALDGIEGERMALRGAFDAIVLDLMLPGRDGLEILAAVRREHPTLPVIVLTARGEIEDRVTGLEAGAVDYLVKPFSMAELVARVRAQLRVIAEASTSTLEAEGIEVDLLSRKVRRDGRPVLLSTTEFELLVFLMRRHGNVVSREDILGSVWGYEHDPATNVVDVYVGYLRRKLGTADRPAPIHTVRAVGYRLGSAG
jgi:DNA-binding response OmpR family regulator